MRVQTQTYGSSAPLLQPLGTGMCALNGVGLNSGDPRGHSLEGSRFNGGIGVAASSPRQLNADDLWKHGRLVQPPRVLSLRSAVYRILFDSFDEASSVRLHLGSGASAFSPLYASDSYEHFLPRYAKSFLQKAIILHDSDNLLFTTNYDRVVGRLASSWGAADCAEFLIEKLRSKVNHFEVALDSVWSSTMGAVGNLSLTSGNSPEHICSSSVEATWNPLFSLTSCVASVVSKAQCLLNRFKKGISRLVKLRMRFIAPEDRPPIFRVIIERQFFCIHGFHPPDSELPHCALWLLFTGYVPGLLPS